MKKKLIALALILVLALPLVSCFRSDNKYDYDLSKYLTIADYKGYKVSIPLDQLTATIDNALLNYATKRLVKEGDSIVINIKSAKCILGNGDYGPEITDLIKKDLEITNVGNGDFIKDFELALVGMSIGESKNIEITIPESFKASENSDASQYAGKELLMTVEVSNIACKRGDGVSVDFIGYYTTTNEKGELVIRKDKDGKEESFTTTFTSSGSNPSTVYLGSRMFIEDFENGVVGMKVGETKEVIATFPDDYHSEDLKGQKTIFKITLKSVLEVPIYNDEFIKKNMTSYGYTTTAEYEQALLDNYVKNTVYSHLSSDSKVIKYPKSEYKLIEDNLKANDASFKATYGYDFDTYLKNYYGMTREQYIQSQVLTEMIYYTISKAENIVPTQEMLDKARTDLIEKNKKEYLSANTSASEKDALDAATKYVDETLGSVYVYETTMYKMVDDFILKSAVVTKEDKTYTSVTEERAKNA